jgi:hypothetical protein
MVSVFFEVGVEDYCEYQQRLIAMQAPTISFSLQQKTRPLEALTLLIQALKTQRFWINHPAKWWKLMIQAVLIARDLFPIVKDSPCEPLHRLINLSQHAPQPWQGKEVAYCFATLSLWSYQEGRTQKAIDKIRAAIHADPHWGYAEYLLGWYGLLLEGIDPVPHFVRAIQLESHLMGSFNQDPLIVHFPEIKEAVESLIKRPQNGV